MEVPKTATNPSLNIKERLLVAQKTFRLIVANTTALVVDALTPMQVEEEKEAPAGNLAQLCERAEIREDAGAINMSRYMLHREIGSTDFRNQIERSFTDGLPQV